MASWTGVFDNEFSDGNNWDTTPVPPGFNDTAEIFTGNPTVTNTYSVDEIHIKGGILSITATGFLSANVVRIDGGTVEIDNGGALSSDVLISGAAGSRTTAM